MLSNMKKILLFIPVLLMATACDWFVFDNMEGWDATITGKFIDAGTGEQIQFGVPDNYGFVIYEENFEPVKGNFAPSPLTWYARTNGSYTNKLVFSGDYRIQTTQSNNFYPVTEQFSIKKGDNTKDFSVTPYARISNVSFSYDSAKQQIVAKCNVAHGDANKTNGIKVFLLIAQDRFVGKNHNNAEDATATSAFISDGAVELRINTTGGNKSEFKYKQPHYVRIAAQAAHCRVVEAWDEDGGPDWSRMGEATVALAADYSNWAEFEASIPRLIIHHPTEYTSDGTVNPNQVYNYSAVYKVSEDFSTFTEVTDWD